MPADVNCHDPELTRRLRRSFPPEWLNVRLRNEREGVRMRHAELSIATARRPATELQNCPSGIKTVVEASNVQINSKHSI
jgi:hypothetical protein